MGDLGCSIETLWLAYVALGGNANLHATAQCLETSSGLTSRQYDYMAQALNDCYVDLGRDHVVPYSDTFDPDEFSSDVT